MPLRIYNVKVTTTYEIAVLAEDRDAAEELAIESSDRVESDVRVEFLAEDYTPQKHETVYAQGGCDIHELEASEAAEVVAEGLTSWRDMDEWLRVRDGRC